MLESGLATEKFGDILPQIESVLRCGFYTHSPSEKSYWSEGIYHILGIEPFSVECTIENLTRYVLPEDRSKVIAAIYAARNNSVPYVIEFSIRDAKGNIKRVHAENVFKLRGEEASYEGVLKDITETYLYKQALEQKIRQLDKSNLNLQEFVYIASHDLQEPLRKISTFTGRLKSRFKEQLNEEGDMYLDRIIKSTGNMQVLLEDLLSFSRLSFTDKPFEKVDLDECLKSVLSDLEVKIEESGTTVESDPLPCIMGYGGQMKQLFNNLINNSIKFRKQDSPPYIRITAEKLNNIASSESGQPLTESIKLEFADNGIGFEQEYSEKVFQIFQRLNGRSEYAGSGVGLSICKRIVENHKGTISAQSSPGEGAVFTVILPLTQS
jgi:light-regulated signal transduction histidine kinase (bacteriophytochrome)